MVDDLCFAWGVSVASFYGEHGVLLPTIEALDDHLKLGFPITDEYSLSRYALVILSRTSLRYKLLEPEVVDNGN